MHLRLVAGRSFMALAAMLTLESLYAAFRLTHAAS